MSFDDISDNHLMAHALEVWANILETGDPLKSAAACAEEGIPVRELSIAHQQLILRIRNLAVCALPPPFRKPLCL